MAWEIDFDITQEEWGHTHPRAFTRHSPVRVELHHSVMPTDRYDAVGHAKAIQRLHLGKGWNGAFYNVGVHSKTGEIVELRGVGNLSTADATDALTVVLFGDHHVYDGHPVADIISDKAKAALLHIISTAPDPAGLRGHKERPYATACPGVVGMQFVNDFRAGRFLPAPPPQESDEVTPEQMKKLLGKLNKIINRLDEIEEDLERHHKYLATFKGGEIKRDKGSIFREQATLRKLDEISETAEEG